MEESADFLSADFNHNEVFFQTTDVMRTIQSMYSELLGLYPPNKSGAPKLTEDNQKSLDSGVAAPPFKVRNQKEVDS